MYNKVKHRSITQTIPASEAEFLPILRGEAPYYANLNRPAQSAHSYADSIAEIQSWGGFVSILNQVNQIHSYKLYDIVAINNEEQLVSATNADPTTTRYGIIVAEAEFDTVSGLYVNIVVCTFCPNFVYPSAKAPSEAAGVELYLNLSDPTFLASTPSGTVTRVLAQKTGDNSIFFSGTATLW